MSLKPILIKQKINIRSQELQGHKEQLKTLDEQLKALAQEVEKANTSEALDDLEKQVAEQTAIKTTLSETIQEIGKEITSLENELNSLEGEIEPAADNVTNNPSGNVDAPAATEPQTRSTNNIIENRGAIMPGQIETRSQIIARLEQPEVNAFYRNLANAIKEKRDLKGGEKTIPTQVVSMIQQRVAMYSKLYNAVEVIPLQGAGRVLVDGTIPTALWLECCTDQDIAKLALTIDAVELDCYLVGGIVSLCNAHIDDSFINLATYVETRIARSIAKAIDKAIIAGTGSKQPTGIITGTNESNKITIPASFASIFSAYALIGGEDDDEVGEVTAVMNKTTYYAYVLPKMLVTTSEGKVVVENSLTNATLPDGTKIIINSNVPANTMIIGDLKRYALGERQGITLDTSEHSAFRRNRTEFRGVGRYDGKPVTDTSFVVLTIKDVEDAAPKAAAKKVE